MDANVKQVIAFVTEQGDVPFERWLKSLNQGATILAGVPKMEKKFPTLDEIEEQYFLEHPEEMDGYIKLIFEEFAKDNDIGALLSSLRVLGHVRGITQLAQDSGLSRRGVQKALSENGNPAFGSVIAILKSMGYRLVPQKV